jgi:transcriptional regulator GlxA family with amidase domain
MAGFKSAAHFSRMFKSTFGASPNEYRASCTPTNADTTDCMLLKTH